MIVFDDDRWDAFLPLTFTRPVGDLRCGMLKLRQRLQQIFADQDNALWIAPSLLKLYNQRHPDWRLNQPSDEGELLVNSRLIVSEDSVEAIRNLLPGQGLVHDEQVVALRSITSLSSPPSLTSLSQLGFKLIGCSSMLYNDLSSLIHDNERLLRFDFEHYFYDKDNFFETEPGVTILDPYNVWLGEGVVLKPGVVLDASEGPIVIDEQAQVMANAVIIGPAYIGKRSLIKIGAKLYEGCSIGPVCKVGGEVEATIFQAYSNKQHDGFLGHSYIGEWVNIGADTNNSDLKNTYKNVSFYSYRERKKIDSGTLFLGTLIADHAKLGINTSINTGCVIGCGANLWSSALIADHIPSFSWGTADALVPYRFEAFCKTARIVKGRRKLELSPSEVELYEQIWRLETGLT